MATAKKNQTLAAAAAKATVAILKKVFMVSPPKNLV